MKAKRILVFWLLIFVSGGLLAQVLETMTGRIIADANPCNENPCLPGLILALETDSLNYILLIEGAWIWNNAFTFGSFTFNEDDLVVATGIITEKLDSLNKQYTEIQIESLILIDRPRSTPYFVSEDRRWSLSFYNYSTKNSSNEYELVYRWTRFHGDTILDGKNYKKVQYSNEVNYNNWNSYRFIREDSIGRVYLYKKGDDILTHNFALLPGDSIPFDDYDEWYLYVDSVAYKPFGNCPNIRKHIYLSYLHDSFGLYLNIVWIEGIGNPVSFLLIPNDYFISIEWSNLHCYFEEDKLVYGSSENICFEVQNLISQENMDQILITKMQGYLIFSSEGIDTQEGVFQIFDISGRIVYSQTLAGHSEWLVPTSIFPSGIYIYKLNLPVYNYSGKFYNIAK